MAIASATGASQLTTERGERPVNEVGQFPNTITRCPRGARSGHGRETGRSDDPDTQLAFVTAGIANECASEEVFGGGLRLPQAGA